MIPSTNLEQYRNFVPKRPKAPELQEPACAEFSLEYATLEARMAEMAAVEPEEVEVDKVARYLSWSDRACRDLVIQGLGGGDYVVFFWPYVESCLSRKQLAELFCREGVGLPESCRHLQPGAVAFCRGGRLVVYPASGMESLLADYPPLQAEEGFRAWREEVGRYGCLDV